MAVAVNFWTATVLFAQPTTTEPTDDDDAVVAEDINVQESAPQSSLLFEDPSASTEIIDVDAIRDQVSDLSDLLQAAAGVRITSFGGVGRSATVSIRGASGKQVLVLLDGVPLNITGEAADLSTIPLDQLESVEITRGGSSAIYGGSASGGVINLITRSGAPRQQWTDHGSVRVDLGSFGTTNLSLTDVVAAPHRHSFLQLQQQHTKGDFRFTNDNGTTFNSDDDFRDHRRNNDADSGSLLAHRTMDRYGGGVLSLSAEGFWRTRGEPGILTFPSGESKEREARLLGDLTWRRAGWPIGTSTTEVKLYVREIETVFQDPLGEQTGTPLATQQRDHLLGLRLGTTWAASSDWIWTGLLELSDERLNDYIVDNAPLERTSLAGAVRGEYSLSDSATAVVALRGDAFSDQPDRLSPKVGLTWTAAPHWTLRANAANAFRPPSFTELSENRGFVVGNPDLRPEVARTFDLGAEWATKRGSGGVSLFANQTRDLIEYVQIAGFRFKPLNFGRTQAQGTELTGSWKLNPAWSVDGDWTIQSVTDRTGGANRQGHTIPGEPNTFGNLALHFNSQPWESTLTYTVVGSNSLTFTDTKRLPDRETLDWALVYKTPNWKAGLMLDNLLDAEVADLRGFPLPGRSLTLTYTRLW